MLYRPEYISTYLSNRRGKRFEWKRNLLFNPILELAAI